MIKFIMEDSDNNNEKKGSKAFKELLDEIERRHKLFNETKKNIDESAVNITIKTVEQEENQEIKEIESEINEPNENNAETTSGLNIPDENEKPALTLLEKE